VSEYENLPTVEPILPKSVSHSTAPRPPRRSLFWPVLLMGAGVLLLLSNLGYFPSSGWVVLWRFWPLALIALGVDVLIGRRTLGGAIAGGILIFLLLGMALGFAFFAEQIPFLIELGKPVALQFESVAYPVAGLESAHITIDWTSAPGTLRALQDSRNLIEADVAYRGELAFKVDPNGDHVEVILDSFLQGISYGGVNFDDRDAKWEVYLSPAVTLDLWLDAGSGSGDYDLRDLNISYLELDSGSGSIKLSLPSFHCDDRFKLVSGEYDDDGGWETENYTTADYKIDLEIDQGSGSIRIQK